MSTPDIRVRLSPEGVKEVLDALKAVRGQADRTARSGASGFNLMRSAAAQLKTLLPAIGLAAVTAGLVGMTRQALATADAVGKMASKVGASAEGISVLAFAAKTADVSSEQLQGGLTKLAVKIGALQAGSKGAAADFRRLGLSAKDFAGKDTVQAFDLISQRLGKVEDSTLKTELAVQIFGKSGAELIPLLNDLAAQGFGSIEEAARSLGLVIDDETAGTAQAVNDSFTIMKAQAEGLALQFTAGLAPSILDVMTSFREETAGKGVDSMKTFGSETGRILRVVISVFRLFYNIVSGIFSGLSDQIGGLAAVIGALTRGEFKEAAGIWRDMGERSDEALEKMSSQLAEDFERVVNEALTEVKPLAPTKPRGARPPLAPGDDEAAARERAAAQARADRDSARAAEERRRAEEAAGQARFDMEQRLLELTGQQREARLRALDEEIAKQREILAAGGGVTSNDEQSFARIRQVEVARIDFEDAAAKAQQALEQLANQRERINQDVELGITTQREGQLEIARIEAARLPVMQELAAAALTAAQASGDPALIAQAEQLNLQLGQIAVSVAKAEDGWIRFREQASQAIGDDLVNWLTDGIKQVDSLGDAFRQLGDTILATLQRIAVEQFIRPQIESWIGSLFGMFGGSAMSGLSPVSITAQRIPGYGAGGQIDATGGGLIRGPGTGTSDSIAAITTTGKPLLVSNREFIVRAAVVRQPGMLDLLRRLNAGLPRPSLPADLPRFAEGGLIGSTGGPVGTSQTGMIVNQHFNITSPTGSVDRTSQQQVAAAAARGLAQASRRNN